MYVRMYVGMYVCMYACMYVCMYKCMYGLWIAVLGSFTICGELVATTAFQQLCRLASCCSTGGYVQGIQPRKHLEASGSIWKHPGSNVWEVSGSII